MEHLKGFDLNTVVAATDVDKFEGKLGNLEHEKHLTDRK